MFTFFKKPTRKIVAVLFIVAATLLFIQNKNEVQAATAFVNAAHANVNANSATVSKPTNTTNNDIMFTLVMHSVNEVPNTVPAGWALLGTRVIASTYHYSLYWKLAATEGTSYTWGWPTSGRSALTVVAYRGGFNTASPIDVLSNTAYTTTNTTVRAASMNVATANSPIIFFGALYLSAGTTFTQPGVPATMTEDADVLNTTSRFSREVANVVWTGSGATGNMDAIAATSIGAVKHAFAVALKPPNAVPTVTTPTSSAVATSSATIGATVAALGVPASISARGTCLGTTPAPTNCSPEGGTTTGTFTQNWTGMTPGTLYYYRGYATNSTGTGYSSDGATTTLAIPTASLSVASTTISYNTATTINWSSTNATGCTAGGAWSGAKATSGSESTGNLTASQTYTLYCTGPGGNSGTQSVTVTVGGAPTVSANPTSCTISSGASTCTVPFTWSISNATSPNLYNSNTGNTYSNSASGSGISYPITNGTNTVQVRDSSTVLNSTAVTGSCTAGTTWNGSSCAVVVTYYTITATAGSNGTTTPSGVTNVAEGGSQTYSITPDPNYQVATLLIDSGSVTASTTYTFDNVTANHTISATFALIPVTHTITASAGPNGSISPLGATPVNDGSSQAFTITPDNNFYIATLLIDGSPNSTSSPYTFTNVTADHTISATFLQIPTPPGSYTIIASQNPNGTVTPSGSSVVTASSSIMYTITPNTGYDVGSLIIDSAPLASTSTTYTFTNVGTNHSIEATFVALSGTEVPVVSRRRLASITFSGKAFPGGKVSIIQKDPGTENVMSQQDVTNVGGMFQIRFIDVPNGAHSFGLLVKDPDGRTSQSKFFLIDVRMGDEVYKDIVFPPTLDIMNGQVSRGGNVKVFGYASPGHTVRVYINDILVKEALAGNGGVYSFGLPTGALDFGQHKVRAKQINLDGGKESDFSTTKTFIVSKLAVVKADLNGDGKIDIKDWGIFLARFTSRDKELRASVDLNGDGKTDISDFSIFIKTIKKK